MEIARDVTKSQIIQGLIEQSQEIERGGKKGKIEMRVSQ